MAAGPPGRRVRASRSRTCARARRRSGRSRDARGLLPSCSGELGLIDAGSGSCSATDQPTTARLWSSVHITQAHQECFLVAQKNIYKFLDEPCKNQKSEAKIQGMKGHCRSTNATLSLGRLDISVHNG